MSIAELWKNGGDQRKLSTLNMQHFWTYNGFCVVKTKTNSWALVYTRLLFSIVHAGTFDKKIWFIVARLRIQWHIGLSHFGGFNAICI